ncbi:6017_t:CDS:2, partial [Dentiscutata erythropus]
MKPTTNDEQRNRSLRLPTSKRMMTLVNDDSNKRRWQRRQDTRCNKEKKG